MTLVDNKSRIKYFWHEVIHDASWSVNSHMELFEVYLYLMSCRNQGGRLFHSSGQAAVKLLWPDVVMCTWDLIFQG